jgi:hypothetical protein
MRTTLEVRHWIGEDLSTIPCRDCAASISADLEYMNDLFVDWLSDRDGDYSVRFQVDLQARVFTTAEEEAEEVTCKEADGWIVNVMIHDKTADMTWDVAWVNHCEDPNRRLVALSRGYLHDKLFMEPDKSGKE